MDSLKLEKECPTCLGTGQSEYWVYRGHTYYTEPVPKGKAKVTHHTVDCYTCYGARSIITEFGQKILDFVKKNGGFAEENHEHTIR